ncbi:MAG TPA: hypothetical protein VHA11_08200 [Bryobacteraceae bacterium]|nr:hypothetical protein [Bryobacteraceae bacterium]
MTCLLLAVVLPALAASEADAPGAIKLEMPRMEMKINEASATMSPWIDANGWRILRNPGAQYYYDVPGQAAALAAAEAFAYRARARIHTDEAGTAAFHAMLEFLRGLPELELPPLANIGVIDDGSEESGELMNLLARRNLLYRVVPAPDPALDMNVRIGSPEYPAAEAADSYALAQRVRGRLGDDKRLVRIFGSDVVLVRLEGDGKRARVHLLNFSKRHVYGLRVRVLGDFPRQRLFSFDGPGAAPADVSLAGGATEFTIPDMGAYAVADLSR